MNGIYFIKLTELAKNLHLPYKTLYNDVNNGKLKASKSGGNYIVSNIDAQEYVLTKLADARGITLEEYEEQLKIKEENTTNGRILKIFDKITSDIETQLMEGAKMYDKFKNKG